MLNPRERPCFARAMQPMLPPQYSDWPWWEPVKFQVHFPVTSVCNTDGETTLTCQIENDYPRKSSTSSHRYGSDQQDSREQKCLFHSLPRVHCSENTNVFCSGRSELTTALEDI